jgi:DnaJ-class molecular chaperone
MRRYQYSRKCNTCKGSGKVTRTYTETVKCSQCKGDGKIQGFGMSVPCKKCDGRGNTDTTKTKTEKVKCTSCDNGWVIDVCNSDWHPKGAKSSLD